MTLNDVKTIAIPNYNYRRLEYIHFSGAEYLDTGKTLTGPNTYKRIQVKTRFQNTNKWSYCGYIGNGNNLCFGTRPTNLATFSLGAVSYGANAYTLATNTIYTLDLYVGANNSNNLSVLDASGTSLWTSSALSASWSGDTGNLYIGAANQTGTAVSFMEADIYSFIVRQPSYGAIIFNGIPCQRKSDGVCGMFDIISKVFIPMQGTNITDAAAGTITQENMLFNVDKIEDSNNTIIWGSFDKFPYRLLEYIHFNGTDNYINPAVGTKSGYYRSLHFDLERKNTRQMTFACYDGTANNNFSRYYVLDFDPNNNVRAANGGTFSSATAISNIPLNTRLRVDAVNSTVSSKPRMSFNLRKADGTYLIATTTIDGTTNGSVTSLYAYIMADHIKDSSGTEYANAYTQGKVYYFEERQGTYQGTYTKRLYPCQRKSDGKYGMFDIIKNNFYVLEGTQDSTSAGPIVNEYWDLTAPE